MKRRHFYDQLLTALTCWYLHGPPVPAMLTYIYLRLCKDSHQMLRKIHLATCNISKKNQWFETNCGAGLWPSIRWSVHDIRYFDDIFEFCFTNIDFSINFQPSGKYFHPSENYLHPGGNYFNPGGNLVENISTCLKIVFTWVESVLQPGWKLFTPRCKLLHPAGNYFHLGGNYFHPIIST